MNPAVRHVYENPASAAEIRAFQTWEAQNAGRMLLRYADFPVTTTFGLRPGDIVTTNSKTTIDFGGREPRLFDERGAYLGALTNTPVDLLRQFVASLGAQRPIGEICRQPPFAQHAANLQALVAALLGRPFLIPRTVEELERQLPAVELLRFPNQSVYTMPREYWENSIAVRRALDDFYTRLDGLVAFTGGLLGLHRLATLGATGTNYYGGAGGIATVPGELRDTTIRNRLDERKRGIISRWLQLLAVSPRLVDDGSIVATNGVELARITDAGHECHHPYGQAGRHLASQLDVIRIHLADALAALDDDRGRFLRHCALFHHAFAHAHPFANINNSIAMNIVNDLLRRGGVGVVPHLYFDQAAFLLQPEDYVPLFARAVDAHVVNDAVGRSRPATAALLEAVASDFKGG